MTVMLNAEYATVGGLMLAPAVLRQLEGWLRPGDFADPVPRLTFSVILAMNAREVPVDPVTVHAELNRRGAVRSDGYPTLELVRMVEAVPVPAATSYYARLVLADAIGRGVAQVGERLVQLGATPREPADLFAVVSDQLRALGELRHRWGLASGTTLDAVDFVPHDLGREPMLLAAAIADLNLPDGRDGLGLAL